ILLYEAYSSLLYLLAEEEQTAEPARLAQVYIQEDNLFLRLMTAQREDKLFQCLQGLTLHHQELSLEEKDLEDAISLTLKIQKGGSSHA
ncbi:MAG: hypothetical protein RR472_07950, partial [Anaerovoracaceae bacterium]